MDEKILLSHGAGGRQAETLIREEIIRPLQNQWLMRREDSAVMDFNGKMAFTTDSHVVSPLFFPGGDIGRLSVCGTVNDLAMAGAQPLFLSLGLIMEEGLSLSVLRDVIASIRKTAETAGVAVVTGDTKVVPRGQADQLYINTAGVGKIPEGVNLSATAIQPGDCLVINGTVGDHGLALLSCREELAFSTTLKSDCAPLHDLTATMLKAVPAIRCLRDPTRGGPPPSMNGPIRAGAPSDCGKNPCPCGRKYWPPPRCSAWTPYTVPTKENWSRPSRKKRWTGCCPSCAIIPWEKMRPSSARPKTAGQAAWS